MMLQRVRGKQQPQAEARERIDEDDEPLVLPNPTSRSCAKIWRRSERP